MDVRFAHAVLARGDASSAGCPNTGHWPDTGGMVPGGFSASAISVEQEGLRLPPVKLFKRGAMDPEIYGDHPLQHPRRRPAHRRRQGPGRGAAGRRASGSRALLDRYGDATVRDGHRRDARPRRRADAGDDRRDPRGHLSRRAPSSTATAWSNEPLTIALAVTRSGDELALRLHRLLAALRGADELGAAPPRSRRSTSPCGTSSPTCRSAPAPSSRCTSPASKGTFLDAHYPRPVSGCAAEVSQRIAEAVFAALVQALPDRVTAAPAGTSGNFALGGHDPDARRATT